MSKNHKPRIVRPHDKKSEPKMFGKASVVSAAVIACGFLAAFATMEPENPGHLKAYAINARPGDKVLIRHWVDAMNAESQSDDWLEAIQAAQKIKEARHGR